MSLGRCAIRSIIGNCIGSGDYSNGPWPNKGEERGGPLIKGDAGVQGLSCRILLKGTGSGGMVDAAAGGDSWRKEGRATNSRLASMQSKGRCRWRITQGGQRTKQVAEQSKVSISLMVSAPIPFSIGGDDRGLSERRGGGNRE